MSKFTDWIIERLDGVPGAEHRVSVNHFLDQISLLEGAERGVKADLADLTRMLKQARENTLHVVKASDLKDMEILALTETIKKAQAVVDDLRSRVQRGEDFERNAYEVVEKHQRAEAKAREDIKNATGSIKRYQDLVSEHIKAYDANQATIAGLREDLAVKETLLFNVKEKLADLMKMRDMTLDAKARTAAEADLVAVSPKRRAKADPVVKDRLRGFDDIWDRFNMVYPVRNGSQNKAKAKVKLRAILTSGVTEEVIMDGAQNYREWCDHNRKTKTEFVAQMLTWLNGERWKERLELTSPPYED